MLTLPSQAVKGRGGRERRSATLQEADDYLAAQLENCNCGLKSEEVRVQAFRCDLSKPEAQQNSQPFPEDPWYEAYDLYAERLARMRPKEIILLLTQKDSQS